MIAFAGSSPDDDRAEAAVADEVARVPDEVLDHRHARRRRRDRRPARARGRRSNRCAISAANRTATSAVSERSVATSTRPHHRRRSRRGSCACGFSRTPMRDAESAALELGRPLLEERGQALLRVLGREREVEEAALVVEPERERRPRRARLTASFASRFATGPLAAISRRQPLRLRRARPRAATTRATSPAASASRAVRAAAGEDHVHRERLADGAREPLRAAGAREEAEARSPAARTCAVSEATIRSQLIASSQPPPRQKPETAATSGVRTARIASQRSTRFAAYMSMADAVASSPMSAPAANARSEPREDDAADSSSASSSRSAVDELAHQRLVERVQPLGPVERDGRDPALRVALDEDEPARLSHRASSRRSRCTAPCASSPSIDSASQSRAWSTVSCQERSRQKLSCCFA